MSIKYWVNMGGKWNFKTCLLGLDQSNRGGAVHCLIWSHGAVHYTDGLYKSHCAIILGHTLKISSGPWHKLNTSPFGIPVVRLTNPVLTILSSFSPHKYLTSIFVKSKHLGEIDNVISFTAPKHGSVDTVGAAIHSTKLI